MPMSPDLKEGSTPDPSDDSFAGLGHDRGLKVDECRATLHIDQRLRCDAVSFLGDGSEQACEWNPVVVLRNPDRVDRVWHSAIISATGSAGRGSGRAAGSQREIAKSLSKVAQRELRSARSHADLPSSCPVTRPDHDLRIRLAGSWERASYCRRPPPTSTTAMIEEILGPRASLQVPAAVSNQTFLIAA